MYEKVTWQGMLAIKRLIPITRLNVVEGKPFKYQSVHLATKLASDSREFNI